MGHSAKEAPWGVGMRRSVRYCCQWHKLMVDADGRLCVPWLGVDIKEADKGLMSHDTCSEPLEADDLCIPRTQSGT
jgi:hypothetical protein